jgi:hypothetical protein
MALFSYLNRYAVAAIILAQTLSSCGSSEQQTNEQAQSVPAPAQPNAPVQGQSPPSSDSPAPKSAVSKPSPPTLAEIKSALSECKSLIAQADDILTDPRIGPNEDARAYLQGERIGPWRDEEAKWESQMDAIGTKRVQAAGAGVPFNPKIAYADENLGLARNWVWESMVQASFGRRRLGLAYIRGAKAAALQAEGVLSGKVKIDPLNDIDKGILTVPKYIEDADNSPENK